LLARLVQFEKQVPSAQKRHEAIWLIRALRLFLPSW
jgi:hypothetical protein